MRLMWDNNLLSMLDNLSLCGWRLGHWFSWGSSVIDSFEYFQMYLLGTINLYKHGEFESILSLYLFLSELEVSWVFYVFDYGFNRFYTDNLDLNIYNISWTPLSFIFISWYLLYYFYGVLVILLYSAGKYIILWSYFLIAYIYSWLYSSLDKVDSVEEALCLVVLWPWCIFLVFTHLTTTSEYILLYGFAEWGLPIFYGLLLLLEHLVVFGTTLVTYLMGIRGRGSIIATFIEDLIAFIIMIARVVLQAIRGIIVGMFHFICREALLNMGSWWEYEFLANNKEGEEYLKIAKWYDGISLVSDMLLASGGLLLVIAIMFLQLTFLVVSIWLFCKCWFMSFGDEWLGTVTLIKLKLGVQSRVEENEGDWEDTGI